MLHHVLAQEMEASTPHIEISLQPRNMDGNMDGPNQKNILESENARHEVGDITTLHHSKQRELGEDLFQ